MASQSTNQKFALYPEVNQSNGDTSSAFRTNASSSPSLYPSIDMKDLVENLFSEIPHYSGSLQAGSDPYAPSAPPSGPCTPSAPLQSVEETLITVPGGILHLIDQQYSVELACGDFSIICLREGESIIAIFARVADEIQWPLAKDVASVKLDDSHYFFSFLAPEEYDSDSVEHGRSHYNPENQLNYGLTFASKGQKSLLIDLDSLLQHYSSFSTQKVLQNGGVLDATVAKEMSPNDLGSEKKKESMEEKCAAYWTTLAPNVEDYSGSLAKLIATGSGQLIKGILWCGDVTSERLKSRNENMKKRTVSGKQAEISPQTLKRIQRVKRVTKMTNKVANGILSGVLKVSGYFTSSIVNSKVGKKFFSLLPGEVILASLDGFNKVCDAVEVAGKNVMSTSSTVTSETVEDRYGETAGKAANDSLHAAGNAIGTAWAVFKIRKAINPKSVFKASTIAKSAAKAAAAEAKAAK